MIKKEYKRDKRSPQPKNETVSKVMSANIAKNTKPEIILRKALWTAGLKGYRKNYKKIAGRPDIAYPKYKLAIFVHGCFWHHCSKCNLSLPKNNSAFWEEKFKNNRLRDKRKINDLNSIGWRVLVIWECDIKTGLSNLINIIEKSLV
jgi:DNA mismatch endonuclease (patch repair protein)